MLSAGKATGEVNVTRVALPSASAAVSRSPSKAFELSLFHPAGDVNEKNTAWIVSMMRFSDTVYVDLDNITELGIVCVLTQETSNVIIISNKKKRKGMIQLLNTMAKYNIYDSVDDYAHVMLDSLETV